MERRTLEYIVTVTEPVWDAATGRWSATAEIEDEDEIETRFHAREPLLAREKAIGAVLESLGRRMRRAVAKADDMARPAQAPLSEIDNELARLPVKAVLADEFGVLLKHFTNELVRLSAKAVLADELGVLLERFAKLDGTEAYQTTEDFYAEVDAQLLAWKASRGAQ